MNNEDKIKLMDFLIEHKLIKIDNWSYCGIEEYAIIFPKNYISVDDEKIIESIQKLIKK